MPTRSDPVPGEWDVAAEAPAKLNLALSILGKREDGFHNIFTIFQAIDLMDRLWFRTREKPGVVLKVTGPARVAEGPENLVVRAGELLAGRRGRGQGVEVLLHKEIPAGSGLGGGSSDAAATLLALEKLWGLDPDPEALRTMALELGSDVPFFLQGGTARGEGRGEILTPLRALPSAAWLLWVPNFPIATSEAYKAVPTRLTSTQQKTIMLENAIKNGEFKGFIENIVNDLEVGVDRMQPRLAQVKHMLLAQGAKAAGMTGSGSALFAVFDSQGAADRVLREALLPESRLFRRCTPVDYGARVVSQRRR